jgi:hypothetical protein
MISEEHADALTVCRVPVVVHLTESEPTITITRSDGTHREHPGTARDQETSRQIFDHSGDVALLDVFVPRERLRRGV